MQSCLQSRISSLTALQLQVSSHAVPYKCLFDFPHSFFLFRTCASVYEIVTQILDVLLLHSKTQLTRGTPDPYMQF